MLERNLLKKIINFLILPGTLNTLNDVLALLISQVCSNRFCQVFAKSYCQQKVVITD